VDTTCEFIVIKVDRRRHNIVVSRRAFLEKSRSSNREKILASIEQGQRIKGVVKNITDYGAFIDLGGIDGLLHISDISWKRINKITDDVLRIDQEIDVIVTRVNKESQRISLGIKQLENDPWDNIHERIKEGDVVEGEICNIREYGAFVRLDSGLEGLAHANNLVWCKRSPKPEEVFSVGQRVKSKILEISEETRRISLGIKECTENPLIAFAETHPTGTVIPITVKEITDFGLIVEITKDIDSTVPKIALPDGQEGISSRYEPGKVLQAQILKIIPEKEFISLDLSQDKNSWKNSLGDIKKDDVVHATVSAISDKSIHATMAQDIQSEIFASNLSVDKDLQDPRRFHIGQEVKAKVISIDTKNKKINLSIRALEEDSERLALKEYESGQKKESGTSLGKAFEAANKKEEE
jgi:small subunit ribosomal protein S1